MRHPWIDKTNMRFKSGPTVATLQSTVVMEDATMLVMERRIVLYNATMTSMHNGSNAHGAGSTSQTSADHL